MTWRRIDNYIRLLCAVALLMISSVAAASEYRGQVTFGGLPVPGATVTAIQHAKRATTITDQIGIFSFSDLTDGAWTIQVEMTGFSTVKQDVTIAPNVPAVKWELKLLPLDQIKGAAAKPVPSVGIAPIAPEANKPAGPPAPGSSAEELKERAAEGLLINGSANNAATSPYALAQAFGNSRKGRGGLYNGSVGMTLDNDTLDARPYSLTGLNTPKPAYSNLTGLATFGGPLKIPHFRWTYPNFFVAYQWTRDSNATTESAAVPSLAERNGDFSQVLNTAGQPVEIFNPATGLPFPGSVIPISPQAQALLKLYPSPNFNGGTRYNYQVPIITNVHQDALESRFDDTLNSKNQLQGGFAFESTRQGSPNVFGFLDTTDVLGINTSINWSHRISERLFMTPGYSFSRLRTRVTPYFENRQNVSGEAGISGNNQEPTNWGPPALTFSSGIAGLSDGQSAFNRNQTNAWSDSMLWVRGRHNFAFGGNFRRQEFNYLSQQDPRGMFSFTGTATQGVVNGVTTGGSDFADFLLGIPDTSSIAFGNADKYFRQSVYDVYITDDWRIEPEFTLNAGIRWEYGAPITELFGRLVNLDITPGFAASAPVVANNPVGPLTGQRYPGSLIQPDKHGFEPRVGIAWRPIAGSSLVVRAGYGIYDDTSIYQSIAIQMAQQSPLSKSLSVENSAACPLTLANGFNPCSATTENTFAVDPNIRVGYAQNWQLAVERDLPGSLQLTATYLGIKGTRGQQQFLPNTYPVGAANPCPSCPVGFAYLASNGNSTREAGTVQLRRRLHNGFTGTLQYAFSKSIDDDSALGGQGPVSTQNASSSNSSGSSSGSGGSSGNSSGSGSGNSSGGNPSAASSSTSASPSTPTIAQNWLNLRGERGLSTFDQRNLFSLQLQYTTGMGMGGGTLSSGWRGTLFKEWTFFTLITAGSGLPQTPVYAVAVPGTGVATSIRPNYTGAPIYAAAPGYFLNAGAYAAPTQGQWGSAGRNSIIGPSEFGLNASAGRTFRITSRYNLDLRVDSTNMLNHVTYTTWNSTVTSPQFGLPIAANAMRSMQTTLRLRF